MDGTGSNTNHIESLLQSIYDSRKECEQRNDNDDVDDNNGGGGGILRVLFMNSTKDAAKDASFNVHSLIAEQSTGCNSLFQQQNLKENNNNNVVLLPEFIETQLWLLCISWMYFGRLCFHPNSINHAKSKNISDNDDDDDAVTLSTFLALWKVAADTGIDMTGLQQYLLP